jgi:regulator of nonsense transcripts 1
MTPDDEVVLELAVKNPPLEVSENYKVEFVWKSTTYSRIKSGLKRFYREEDAISNYLYWRLLGYDSPSNKTYNLEVSNKISAPNLPKLNMYQNDAVKKALNSELTLIQGPPGTGKTITSASIVYHLIENIRKKKLSGKVMVCAPSNIVVDHLAEKISMTGAKVVRVCSKSREIVSASAEPLSLHHQVRSLDIPSCRKLKDYMRLIEETGELSKEDEDNYKMHLRQSENIILEAADVICCTCVTSFDPRLKPYRFPFVLIDEATQAIESECLLPLLKGAKQVVLVGDHMQLGPVVICREAANAGLKQSLFERLVKLQIKPIRLQVQYRMHPDLSVFPSNTFYEGALQNGVTASDRKLNAEFNWPSKDHPMFFWHVRGQEELSASGTSY